MMVAQRQLDQSISAIEATHSKPLTPAARMMLQAILVESLTTRESEWRVRAGIILESVDADTQIRTKLNESFGILLQESWLKQSGDYITTRDLLAAVQSKWCNIFPIC